MNLYIRTQLNSNSLVKSVPGFPQSLGHPGIRSYRNLTKVGIDKLQLCTCTVYSVNTNWYLSFRVRAQVTSVSKDRYSQSQQNITELELELELSNQ